MRDEVHGHNEMLRDMGKMSGQAQSGLEGTLKQLEELVAAGGGATNVCAVTGLAVVVFLVVYFVFLR
jgi:hypothetical protein